MHWLLGCLHRRPQWGHPRMPYTAVQRELRGWLQVKDRGRARRNARRMADYRSQPQAYRLTANHEVASSSPVFVISDDEDRPRARGRYEPSLSEVAEPERPYSRASRSRHTSLHCGRLPRLAATPDFLEASLPHNDAGTDHDPEDAALCALRPRRGCREDKLAGY